MGFEVDAFDNDVSGWVDSMVSRPESAKTNMEQDDYEDMDVRESVLESATIPRESMFGTPPPVPRKDTTSDTQFHELPSQQPGNLKQSRSEERGDKDRKEFQKMHSTLGSMLGRQNSTASGEIRIHFTPSTQTPRSTEKTLTNTMFTLHPLAMSPPSPMVSLPKLPQRPARPSSLRLSSFARKRDLTTSRIVVLNTEKPETAASYQTQPHTGYNSSSRTKYGRGKHAATELIPQPSDDPQDPLVGGGEDSPNAFITIADRRVELASLEERVASVRPAHDGCVMQRHEDGVGQCQRHISGTFRCIICCSIRLDRRAAHVVGHHGTRELHSIKSMGQEAPIPGVSDSYFYRFGMDRQDHR